MASHHNYHRHHHQNNPPTSCDCTRNSCSCGCLCNQSLHYYPPQIPSNPLPTDPLLQALASQLLQSNTSHAFTHYTQNLSSHLQFPHFRQRLHNQEPISAQESKTHLVISSLLARIEALEASLYRFSSHRSASSYSHSIRDLAACAIQRHFRAFLVRRSRTLCQLKELAMIKSAFCSIKSNQTHFDFQILSRKATTLLLKLDSIKGSDPMVRDGKRSISRDLVRFLDFIDGVSVKRHELSFRSMRNARHGNCDKPRVLMSKNCGNLHANQKEVIGKLKDRLEKISGFKRYFDDDDEEGVEHERFQHISDEDDEVDNPKTVINGKNGRIKYGALLRRQEAQPRVKKRVSFAEERNMSMVSGDTYEPISHGEGTCLDDDYSSDDHEELVNNLCSEVERIKSFSKEHEEDEEEEEEEEEEMNNADISKASYEGRTRIEGSYENADYVFSAPLPVQMEAKMDLLKRRNEMTILR